MTAIAQAGGLHSLSPGIPATLAIYARLVLLFHINVNNKVAKALYTVHHLLSHLLSADHNMPDRTLMSTYYHDQTMEEYF